MNLIEQLGGYEKAKTELRIVKIQNSSNYSHDDIEQSLLQYRRANNIFEVGDKVVFNDDDVYREESSIYKIFEVLDGGEVVLSSDECIDPMIIRHATDAEIKADERL